MLPVHTFRRLQLLQGARRLLGGGSDPILAFLPSIFDPEMTLDLADVIPSLRQSHTSRLRARSLQGSYVKYQYLPFSMSISDMFDMQLLGRT